MDKIKLNGVMEKIVIPLLTIAAKLKKSDPVVDIFATLVEARTILVIMPDKVEDFGIARKFIAKLMDDFSTAKFQFVMRQNYQSLLNDEQNYGTIFVSDKDVNFWGLPKKELKDKILATEYDIVIDLNHEFHLPSTYLCLKSRASLKICFDHNKREPFYNFYFRTPTNVSLNSKYKKLIQYLKNDIKFEPAEN
jgi:ADP-heptose:LPS heptosyltransferase